MSFAFTELGRDDPRILSLSSSRSLGCFLSLRKEEVIDDIMPLLDISTDVSWAKDSIGKVGASFERE